MMITPCLAVHDCHAAADLFFECIKLYWIMTNQFGLNWNYSPQLVRRVVSQKGVTPK